MKLHKTDARYKLHKQGFLYVAKFNLDYNDRILYGKIRKYLTKTYGTAWQLAAPGSDHPLDRNLFWGYDLSNKVRRIYVKEATIITIAVLVAG